jgi:hypothetical protein
VTGAGKACEIGRSIRMNIPRPPEERFAGLPDFPYASQYPDLGGLRVRHITRGDGNP